MGGAFPHLQCHESMQCAHVGVDVNGKVFLFLFKNNLLLYYKIKIFIYICIANLSHAAQSACALKVNNHRLSLSDNALTAERRWHRDRPFGQKAKNY